MTSSSERAVPIVFEPAGEAPAGFVPDPPRDAAVGFEPAGCAREANRAAASAAPSEPIDVEALERRAFEQGVASGRAELPWGEAERLETAARALERAVGELAELQRDYLAANRHVVVELALAVAERLTRRTLAEDPCALGEALGAALAPLSDAPAVRVSLAPQDLETLQAGGQASLAAFAAARSLETRADPTLHPGDVRVAAGASQVDARVETLLEQVRDALEDALGAPMESGS